MRLEWPRGRVADDERIRRGNGIGLQFEPDDDYSVLDDIGDTFRNIATPTFAREFVRALPDPCAA